MFEYALYLTTAATITIIITNAIIKITITTTLILLLLLFLLITIIMTNHLTTIALESAITARDSLNKMLYHQICHLHQAS